MTGGKIVRKVWDGVPEPGPEPPLPEGEPPAPGDPNFAEYRETARARAEWLRRVRRHQLALAMDRLEGSPSTEERVADLTLAVRALGAMVLAGEVGPEPFTSLLDMFGG